MARLTEEEREIKKTALNNALEILIKQSTLKKNLVTYENVCTEANKMTISKKFNTKISISSIKQSKAEPFLSIRQKIMQHNRDSKKTLDNIPQKTQDEIKKMKHHINDLLSKIIVFEEKNKTNEKKIAFLEEHYRKIKEERDQLFSELNSVGPPYDN